MHSLDNKKTDLLHCNDLKVFFLLCLLLPGVVIESPHDKTNKMSVRPAKTQINLGICPVWSESSLCAQWVAKDPSFFHVESKDWSNWADTQAGLSLRWAHMPFIGFGQAVAHIGVQLSSVHLYVRTFLVIYLRFRLHPPTCQVHFWQTKRATTFVFSSDSLEHIHWYWKKAFYFDLCPTAHHGAIFILTRFFGSACFWCVYYRQYF